MVQVSLSFAFIFTHFGVLMRRVFGGGKAVNGLAVWLRDNIRKRPEGWISLAEWMDAVLYHPQWGYYMRSKKKIGKDGDYYTSSSFASVFGVLLAEALCGLLQTLPTERWNVVELGGGDGRLARAVLDAVESEPDLYEQMTYYMLEKSPYHRRLQLDNLDRHAKRVVYVDDLEQLRPFSGVVFSNEFFDALPVHTLVAVDGSWHEVGVTWSEAEGRFVEAVRPCEDSRLLTLLEQWHGEGVASGRMEISLASLSWMKRLARLMEAGYVLTIDYGYVSADGKCRSDGTLRGFWEHRLSGDVLARPGEQDVTADVNFAMLVREGEKRGLRPILLERQREFLLRLGILDELVADVTDPLSLEARKNRTIRQIVFDETGMGSRFFVLLQAKNVAVPRQLQGLNRTFFLDNTLRIGL